MVERRRSGSLGRQSGFWRCADSARVPEAIKGVWEVGDGTLWHKADGVTCTEHVRSRVVLAGTTPAAELAAGSDPVVWVGRFSGSTNGVTGDFSGVVKNGFLLARGERRPIRETMIAGNLFEALRNIEAISAERRLLSGSALLPSLRIGGVSVTAG